MTRPALPEEKGHDERPDLLSLDELRRAHDWHTEERADGRYIVDVCEQCGYEQSAGCGPAPDCTVREIPGMWREYAHNRGMIPDAAEGSLTDAHVRADGGRSQ